MTPSQEEFVPQKIVVGRRGRRRGHAAPSTSSSSSEQSTKQQDTITNNITSVPLNDDTQPQQQKQQQKRSARSTAASAPQISSSVVFHEEDTELLINELTTSNDGDIEPSTTQLSSSQQQTTHNTNNNNNTDISSSVVFHEEQIELFDEIDELYPHEHEGGKIVAGPHSSTASPPGVSILSSTTGKVMNNSLSGSLTTSRSLASSVIRSLHESNSLSGSKSYNGVLPTDYASLVASSNDGTLAEMVAEMTMARDNSDKQNANWDNEQQEGGLIRRNKSNPNLQQSLLSTLTEGSHEQSTKMSSISGGESNNNKNRRSSIVGGKPISQMSYEEQRVLMAPDRSDRSLLVNFDNTNNTNNEDDELEITGMIDISERDDVTIVSNFPDNTIDNDNVIVSSTDWSSLSKSCKRAKNDFKDMDSGLTVVRNMFMTHLRPLTAVLTLYSKRCCSSSGSGSMEEEKEEISLNELKSRTTETKRALRFAMSCLAPPRPSGDNNNESGTPSANDVQDGVDIYRVDRRYRQELQEAAVKGFTYTQRSHSLPSLTASTRSANSYNSLNEGGEEGMSRHHYGLQIPLVEIINDNTQSQQCHILEEEINDPALFASIERDKRTVRILAARMLCNLVTDNPLAAELVLKDIPFSPNPDLKERRLVTSILGSREQAQRVDGHQGPKRSNSKSDDEIIFWSDLISVTAKVQPATAAVVNNGKSKRHGDDQSSGEDREELAAVSAALHNLLTSLEARESLLELDDEMKRRRREIAKQQQNINLSSPQRKVSTVIGDDDEDDDNKPITPMDAGFEIASDGTLLNALLRNILPTKAVLMQAKRDKERSEPSRPQFKSSSTTTDDNLSDSATEWISLILERLASRGLLPKMLQSAGGTYMKSKTVTPEQVVLVSCIRQAVDDYHSALTSTGESGGFGRRRLSIAAKSAGITISSRPHPLWGRADPQAVAARDSRTAVPVLLSLANEAEEIRIRENELKQDPSVAIYDGELNCTSRIIVDLVDILAQSLGRHAGSYLNGFQNQRNKPQCFIADARSVLGRETTIIKSCCKDLGRILDMTLAKNQGKKAREMELSEQDQHAAIVDVRLIGNIIFQCRHNQDLIRITPVPMLDVVVVDDDKKSAATAATNEVPTERTGLHVILSTTSLAPVCFTLREWCIVAIRNAMDGNAANAETCRRLEANQVVEDTPELQKLGVKMSLDKNGKVQISRRDNDDT